MGGAFVALADDATAAYSNPAGLTILARREVSIEQRGWRTRNPFTDGGRISGEPSGRGLDTIQGLSRGETSDDTSGLSVLSYVETAPERRWALALYHHTLADYSVRFRSEGVFSASPATPRFGPYRISTTFEVVDTVDGEVRTSRTGVISQDGKILTMRSKGVSAEGQVAVYEKQ